MARDFSVVGAALSAPARSAMLDLLMDGSTRPASELAEVAGVRPAAASEHLATLLAAGLVTAQRRGRQRMFRLAGPEVAAGLEELGRLCGTTEVASLRRTREQRALARARLCYDHLAGRFGLALTDGLVDQGWLSRRELAVTPDGAAALRTVGIDVAALGAGRRPLTRSCPDWTERRPHLAGALGAAIASQAVDRGWVRRRTTGRGLDLAPDVERIVHDAWGIRLAPVG